MTLKESKADLNLLGSDLVNSLRSCLANFSRMQKEFTPMGFDSIIVHMKGNRKATCPVKVDDTALEHYGHDECKEFFAYEFIQDHMQTLSTAKYIVLEPSLSDVIHRKLKVVLKELVSTQSISI